MRNKSHHLLAVECLKVLSHNPEQLLGLNRTGAPGQDVTNKSGAEREHSMLRVVLSTSRSQKFLERLEHTAMVYCGWKWQA